MIHSAEIRDALQRHYVEASRRHIWIAGPEFNKLNVFSPHSYWSDEIQLAPNISCFEVEFAHRFIYVAGLDSADHTVIADTAELCFDLITTGGAPISLWVPKSYIKIPKIVELLGIINDFIDRTNVPCPQIGVWMYGSPVPPGWTNLVTELKVLSGPPTPLYTLFKSLPCDLARRETIACLDSPPATPVISASDYTSINVDIYQTPAALLEQR